MENTSPSLPRPRTHFVTCPENPNPAVHPPKAPVPSHSHEKGEWEWARKQRAPKDNDTTENVIRDTESQRLRFAQLGTRGEGVCETRDLQVASWARLRGERR